MHQPPERLTITLSTADEKLGYFRLGVERPALQALPSPGRNPLSGAHHAIFFNISEKFGEFKSVRRSVRRDAQTAPDMSPSGYCAVMKVMSRRETPSAPMTSQLFWTEPSSSDTVCSFPPATNQAVLLPPASVAMSKA